MHCQNCHAPLHAARSGFLVCPHCRYVNIAVIRPAHEIELARAAFMPMLQPDPNMVEPPARPAMSQPRQASVQLPTPAAAKLPVPILRHISRRAALQFTAAIVASVFIFGFVQNAVAQYRVARAVKFDAAGQYADAAGQLSDVPDVLVLGSIHQAAKKEAARNKKWLQYLGYQNHARDLIEHKQYTEAIAELRKIGKDYPTYQTVLSTIDFVRSVPAGAGNASGEWPGSPTDSSAHNN